MESRRKTKAEGTCDRMTETATSDQKDDHREKAEVVRTKEK